MATKRRQYRPIVGTRKGLLATNQSKFSFELSMVVPWGSNYEMILVQGQLDIIESIGWQFFPASPRPT